MAAYIPTYLDLFGTDQDALSHYKELFPIDITADADIINVIKMSFLKIEPVFGEFRGYSVGEDTVRNEHVKRAVCFETNAIIKANDDPSTISEGGINSGDGNSRGIVTSESMADLSVSYDAGGASKTVGIGDSSLMDVLGLLSADAAILLSRYIRKTYGWGMPTWHRSDMDHWGSI